MDTERKTIALIVPCYNEEETIESFVSACDRFLAPLKDRYAFCTILVDDGSKDRSLKIMKKLAKTRDDIRYISFSKNGGKEMALYAGYSAALKIGASASITMDVDLQDPPELIPQFIQAWEEGYEYIYAHMRGRKGQSFAKRFFSDNYYRVFRLLTGDKKIESGDRDYAMMDRKVLAAFVSLRDRTRFNRGIADFVGFKRKRIDYDYTERVAGSSKFNIKRLLKYAYQSFVEFGHIDRLIPDLFIILSVLGLVTFIILGPLVSWFSFLPLALFALTLVISILARVIISLLYEIRDESRRRPFFFIADTNIEDLDFDW